MPPRYRGGNGGKNFDALPEVDPTKKPDRGGLRRAAGKVAKEPTWMPRFRRARPRKRCTGAGVKKDEGGRMKDERKPLDPSDHAFILHPSAFILALTGSAARTAPCRTCRCPLGRDR